ncbi:hypothetical protein ACIP02_17935 [Pseudomonas sp. NPDC089408]|uniref:hypothetical protein n=1 Tax=Pseudomonas sp. NPDC089408 TaxID=3364465 RepID=UPI00381ED051
MTMPAQSGSEKLIDFSCLSAPEMEVETFFRFGSGRPVGKKTSSRRWGIPFWVQQWPAAVLVLPELWRAMHWEGVVSGEATEFRFGFNVHTGRWV